MVCYFCDPTDFLNYTTVVFIFCACIRSWTNQI